MRVRPKTLEADAFSIAFDVETRAIVRLPSWLRGRLLVDSAELKEGDEGSPRRVGDGDYLVHHGGGEIDLLTAAQFAAKYSTVRQRNKLDDTGLRGSQAPGTDAGGNAE